MKTDPSELQTVLVTDCGSTTTKALLFEKTEAGWRHTFRGEAPTTVEEPVADVTVGALNAFTEIQELSKREFLSGDEKSSGPFIETAEDPAKGIDLYLSTSSAGGGLQMIVAGVVRHMTAESAERAALGAGAIVLDTISAEDGREDHERISRIRHLKPDIVLLTGGVDGGAKQHVIEVAEILLSAAPKPRFGATLKLPVVYAGNRDASTEVVEILEPIAQVTVVENVRPTLEVENLGPAREAIHDFFLHHVMSHSPGYGKLLSWTPVPIVPTPAAVGDMVQRYAAEHNLSVLCADIGGATTDLFSVFKNDAGSPIFNRTVSANLGMSYSIANVLVESGAATIKRWLPYEISESEVRDRLRNKMIRPTSIPQTKDDLWLEQAVCREALRLSLRHHRSLAVGLSGIQQTRGIADLFTQKSNRYELVDMKALDVVIGSGGVLSHAPSRMQAALMMLDGFALEGVTLISVDSIFMMPHLGVFSHVYPDAAVEIFEHDCVVNICHAVAPIFPPAFKQDVLAEIKIDGAVISAVHRKKVEPLMLEQKTPVTLTVVPAHKNIDCGKGAGTAVELKITPAPFGLLLDGRNRPIELPKEEKERVSFQKETYRNLKILDG
jgi:uncharacterized protein (TIGR01319 family)